ncbi:FAD/NAD(P)-binding domain-containing protein [Didymella exigua CBS 183.55]|uniref:FAD/NAD(P)-binding domain-containing protein n=1 Tax=Didymella exigua CBS 183.55 TaxID=1150837 RepID=A0A6A5RGL9_9PLEO|nr:FAD/NAD(P)-binding domain-containing protein [Didymella exigua CBS 183.55]KAF1925646.1 FAD/NAD(P)-binding domain-containing protein [Didymella exigua CBS 183.55]
MAEQRNIVVLGASAAGLQSTHYIMKHILPALKKSKTDAKYHVYLINPSSDWWFRIASPRVAASTTRMSTEQILFDVRPGLKQYSSSDITFIEGTATGLSEQTRFVTYRRAGASAEEALPYHALIVATGSRTHHQAFSMSGSTSTTLASVALTNEKVQSAKDIVIVGGGPTAVEFAGEVAEHRNGKPGRFRTAPKKVNITIVTASDTLLPALRPAIAQAADAKLRALGVDVRYGQRVRDASETAGRTTVTLASGASIDADLYVPAHGVEPNSAFLPAHLLDERKYLRTNEGTLRVDAAGPRVYAAGDVASYSRNSMIDIVNSLPVLFVNLKRDLLAFDAGLPDAKPKGVDRVYVREEREMQIVPIGSGGGVGAVMGWKVPSWFVWMLKGRDYMVGMSGAPTVSGESMKKEVVWTKEEAVI